MEHTSNEKGRRIRRVAASLLILSLFSGMAPTAQGYSVLTHEAIIDSAWEHGIKPLLLKRFPAATPEDLKRAAKMLTKRPRVTPELAAAIGKWNGQLGTK